MEQNIETQTLRNADGSSKFAVEMLNITKTFLNGKVVANDDVNLLVKKNEVHAIIGENGAGKSTLMSILFGLYTPDYGTVKINGEKVNFSSAKDANKVGLGMVHQHFKLVDEFSLFENIILGAEDTKILGIIATKKLKQKVQALNEKYGFNLDLNMKAGNATVGQQQKTEILKLLYRDVDILIFDEPTAVLSDKEIESFLKMIQDFKQEGKTIIIITHKFNEIKSVADYATVIRRGKYVADFNIADKTIEEMAELMVGKKLVEIKNTNDDDNFENREAVLEVSNLNLRAAWKPNLGKTKHKKEPKVISQDDQAGIVIQEAQVVQQSEVPTNDAQKVWTTDELQTNPVPQTVAPTPDISQLNTDVNFKIRSGEIVAIAGVEGNGQSELAYLISGLMKNKTGTITLNGQVINNLSIKKRNELGLSYVPEDRHKHGLILDFSVAENSIINQVDDKPFSYSGILDQTTMYDHAKEVIANFDVRGTTRGTSPARGLSGGNQQKLIIGREMTKPHNLLILVQPTRGLDLGAINFIHDQILQEKAKGNAILLISYELDEILALADTIGVMQNGVLVGYDSARNMTREKIGNYMVGKE